MTSTKSAFRIELAPPEKLRELDREASPELSEHFGLIKQGLEAIPGVPAEAFYGAVTLRALALKPEIFKSWFLTEYHSAKQGEIERSTKELLAMLVSQRIEEDETVACGPYHAGAARFEGASEDAVRIVQSFDSAKQELPELERETIEFGLKVAFDAKGITDADVQRMRTLGLSDAALVELVSTALIAHNLATLNQVFHLNEGAG